MVILTHFTKVLEKAVKLKVGELKSQIFKTPEYQTGFKSGYSTHNNLSLVLNEIMFNSRSKPKAKVFLSVDIIKAYDSAVR